MMQGDFSAVNKIAQFLGPEAARGGPVALLGLSDNDYIDFDIITARDRRMRLIDAHPQSQSPAADEVRLAVHAATAQLLNPAIRSHLRRGAATNARESAMIGLEQDVILTLAMFGGWTRRSLPRLMALAHSRGLKAIDVAETLRRLSRRRPQAAMDTNSQADHAPPRAYEVSRPAGPGLAIGIGGGVVGLIVLAVWIVLAFTGTPATTTAVNGSSPLSKVETPGSTLFPAASDNTITQSGAQTPEPERVKPDEILDTLLEAIAQSQSDIERANTKAVAAADALSYHWLDLPVPVRTRALDAIIELMYRLGGPTGDARELLNNIGRGSIALRQPRAALNGEQVARGAWSVGVLARLRRERDLSAQSYALIDRWLGTALGGTRPAQMSFSGGALAALTSMMEPMATQGSDLGDAWTGWARATNAVTASDASRRVTLLARGAELLMVQPVAPEERAQVYEAILAVVSAMPWTGNDDAKRWMVRQFDNRDVSTASLSAATRTLVAETDAENIDPTMVLSTTASDLSRRALRDRYLLAWGLEAPGSDLAVLDALSKAAGLLDDDLANATRPMDSLRAAVGFARLNAAAGSQWQGDADAASSLLSSFRLPADANPSQVVNQQRNVQADARWAEQYLIAGIKIDAKIKLLEQLRSRGGRNLGAVDAEVLVQASLRGGGKRVRSLARDIVELYGSSPAIVNALLEEAPRMPPSQTISDLIVSVTATPLPNRNSPDWRLAVRRALVERLLELLAADSALAGIDHLSALLDDAYNERAMTHRSTGDSGDSGDHMTPSAERSVRALTLRWTRSAQRSIPAAGFALTLGDVERNRAGRRALASGMIQEFAVEQLALTETMAIVVAGERPGRTDAISKILDELAASRRQASHIFEQISAAERAMVLIWEIRLGVDGI
jgi:hypothetical protein